MFKINMPRKALLFFLIIGIYGFFVTNNGVAAQKWEGVKAKDVVYVSKTASIEKIDVDEGYLLVGDEKFYLADIVRGGKRYKTKLINEEGRPVPIRFFEKGQIVFVGAFAVPDGRSAAFVVKQLSDRDQARVRQGLKYDSSKLLQRLLDSLDKKERHILNSSNIIDRFRDTLKEK